MIETTTATPQVRYLARCPKCRHPHAVNVDKRFASEFLTLAYNKLTHRCRECNCPLRTWNAVKGHYSEGRKCDSRCTGAVGPNCECQCGGHNHGADAL